MVSVCNQVKESTASTQDLWFELLDGHRWQAALSGDWENGEWVQKAYLRSPDLKYYRAPFLLGLRGEKDTRIFCVASVPSTDPDDSRRVPVGLLEMQIFEVPGEMGLKYISVAESHRQQGIASRLYDMAAKYLLANNLKLYRSGRGLHTPPEFTEAISRKLNAAGVTWRQGRDI